MFELTPEMVESTPSQRHTPSPCAPTTINCFPAEIIELIFFNLGTKFKDLVQGLAKVTLVSKSWKEISRSEQIWRFVLETFKEQNQLVGITYIVKTRSPLDYNELFKSLILKFEVCAENGQQKMYIDVIKELLDTKQDFSKAFNSLDRAGRLQLAYLIQAMSFFHNISILNFVERGLSPNAKLPEYRMATVRNPFQLPESPQFLKKVALVFTLINACCVIPSEIAQIHDLARTHIQRSKIENYIVSQPLTEEQLMENLEKFLKLENFDINSRKIHGGFREQTILAIVKTMQGFIRSPQLEKIEQLLIDHRAIE